MPAFPCSFLEKPEFNPRGSITYTALSDNIVSRAKSLSESGDTLYFLPPGGLFIREFFLTLRLYSNFQNSTYAKERQRRYHSDVQRERKY